DARHRFVGRAVCRPHKPGVSQRPLELIARNQFEGSHKLVPQLSVVAVPQSQQSLLQLIPALSSSRRTDKVDEDHSDHFVPPSNRAVSPFLSSIYPDMK